MAHEKLQRGAAPLSKVPRASWIALAVTWGIWAINAFDREVILRLGPAITDHFDLSPEAWGGIISIVMLSLAVLPIYVSRMSDNHGTGWKRAIFQVPLVIGYNLISAITGIKAVAHNLVLFIALRIGVNLGAGAGEPIGISNTTEWWPKERRGFALGVHHTGYPVGALLSGLVVAAILSIFGDENWMLVFVVGLIVAIPLMLFWWKYSTKERQERTYAQIAAAGMTVPLDESADGQADTAGAVGKCLRNKVVMITSGTTLLTQIVYMGINYVLPLYLANIVGLDYSEAAAYSVVFTITGIIGQIFWPTLSDYLGRRTTIVVCGVWMAVGVAAFYFATSVPIYIALQLFFGLVANAVWPVYYAAATDNAPDGAHGTANGFVTTAMFIGGGLAPVLMGWLIGLGGGWKSGAGYVYTFFFMALCALLGVAIQFFVKKSEIEAHHE
ncbi:MFS family permease [Arcanobacterium pluranimalium]|uniref:MFS transporter n=1 Tax=Arcanobacterium pluranimalium TaxID=108028 RepID=UPI0019566397|nr:MFS transporter [Arcanobacterium pluranimalium]MBM7825545.1 MFS family permease [Arcanobacterium pluranimalium]